METATKVWLVGCMVGVVAIAASLGFWYSQPQTNKSVLNPQNDQEYVVAVPLSNYQKIRFTSKVITQYSGVEGSFCNIQACLKVNVYKRQVELDAASSKVDFYISGPGQVFTSNSYFEAVVETDDCLTPIVYIILLCIGWGFVSFFIRMVFDIFASPI